MRLHRIVSWLGTQKVIRSLASVLPDRTGARLWTTIHDMYEDSSEKFYANIYLAHILEVLQSTPATRTLRVLDLGCGYGRMAIPLAKLGFEVVGIDNSQPALRGAQKHAFQEGVAIDFRKHDVQSGIPEIGEFDVVMAIETFPGRLHEITGIVSEASKHLAKDGILAISVRTRYYQTACYLRNTKFQQALLAATQEGDKRWLEPGELRSLLVVNGYTPLKIVGIGVLSGLRQDPFSMLSAPAKLDPAEQKSLERVELEFSAIAEVSGCGRYMLAIARRNENRESGHPHR